LALRYAIVSDVHGNLEALEASLADIGRRRVDSLLFLGDAVGYGPDPDACLKLLRDEADICLAGNHDWAVLGLTDITCFNPVAAAAVLWTKGVIKPENRDYLAQYELITTTYDMCLTHATPYEPEAWHYIFTLGMEAKLSFGCFDTQLCFVGHSHVPVIIEQDTAGKFYLHRENTIDLHSGHKYIINVGSVGQPRDGNPDSCYGIYDTSREMVELVRVTYDTARVQQKIIDAGLPASLAKRLAMGQ
jgi:diadenosine tetraphosphatase ApaH/serine/threonine PP2A family protein phosphatase